MTEENPETVESPVANKEEKPETHIHRKNKIRFRKVQKHADIEVMELTTDRVIKTFYENKASSISVLLFSDEAFRARKRFAENHRKLLPKTLTEFNYESLLQYKMGPTIKSHFLLSLKRLDSRRALYQLLQSIIRAPEYSEITTD
ncbi:hypothetical protein D915_005417 [Fasciola hepatica]|uniref:Uncharacterized protein n=1 Tax=Fasciola hepatica TaxID=6192 RepID=A0A4E0RAM0_FASHE|nr:hypothetical protein D915_005417 [Fasciola hepatica]